MTTLSKLSRLVKGTSLGLALCMTLTMALSGAAFGSPVAISPMIAPVHTATGATQQWAFGGNASAAYSCMNNGCFGANLTGGQTITLSFHYYIGWVVIYTQTNVSSTQTQVEGQAALNVSAAFSVSGCLNTNGTGSCHQVSESLNIQGLETAVGFTNLTAGTVNLTPSGSFTGSNVAATAIMNAASSESFNFSGNLNVQGIAINSTSTGGTASFVFGGNESSTVNFPSPLGLVPLNPSPGDTWTAFAPYSATGGYHSGYSLTENIGGHSAASGQWLSGHVAPSGNLSVNGTDLGSYTLWDNYTNPATSTTAQIILLDFGAGGFAASDGWVMVPAVLYSGLGGYLGILSGSVSPAAGAQPNAGLSGLTTGESAYYQQHGGIIGTSASGTSSLSLPGSNGSAPHSLSVKAGPEPVSVAESQYKAITTSQGGGSSSSSFPTVLVVVAVVVVLAGLLAALVVMRRRRRAPPAAYGGPQGGAPPGVYPGQMPPGPGGYPPAPGYPTPPPPTSPGTGPGQ
ncbi:MAG: hypothetical protein L3K07_00150 [Thermoplasmata archaeon]|nr:hypothetical protein [Thermoplasmata archaeon]